MREIKVRAWDEKNKKFYYSVISCILNKNNDYIFLGEQSAHPDFFGGWNETDTELELEQFTGLYDKNGKEIYENDILGFPKLDSRILVKIEISSVKDRFGWGEYGYSTISGFYFSGYGCISLYEVIGNIHENPELIK